MLRSKPIMPKPALPFAKLGQCAQRADVNLGRRAYARQGASGVVEHPCRNLEPPVRRRSRLAAAKSILTRPHDLLMNVNTTP